MNAFADSWKTAQTTTLTENGDVTFTSSTNAGLDLFFTVGALRGQGTERLYRLFATAFGENPYLATRVMLWARDIRGGAGERQIFRDLLVWLEANAPDVLELVLPKVPELGRWDDLTGKKDHVFKTEKFRMMAFDLVEQALRDGNKLAAKWMPRNGVVANALMKHFGLSPRQYRKVLTKLTEVVENLMCSKQWSSINYEHVPSLAQIRYTRAFGKHDPVRYSEYASKAKKYSEYLVAAASADAPQNFEEPEKVKINAAAVYPYDVLKPLISEHSRGVVNYDTINAQWNTLPNFVGSENVLPVVDVSGSMYCPIPGSKIQAIDVSVSLGLYLATKNRGAFNNIFMTFSSSSDLVTLKGKDITTCVQQLVSAHWGMSTNIDAAFANILRHAKTNNVPAEDMPASILVISDMEFNAASSRNTAFERQRQLFADAGYRLPNVVWWNVMSRHDNVPVKNDTSGTALVSGFSPTIVKNVLSGDSFSPEKIMLKTIMDPRYDLDMVRLRAA